MAGQQIAYNDVCQLVGDLFISRWLDNKEKQEEFKTVTGDLQRQIEELLVERTELVKKVSDAEAPQP